MKCGLICSESPIGSVGVDAHIDPADKPDFTEISGEFDDFSRGDVGIAPYARLGIRTKIENSDED